MRPSKQARHHATENLTITNAAAAPSRAHLFPSPCLLHV